MRVRSAVVVLSLALAAVTVRPAGAQDSGRSRGDLASVDSAIAKRLSAIESAEARKKRVKAELEGLDDKREAARERLRDRTRALYRITRAGMLPLAGGFPALLAHIGRVSRLERMVEGDMEALDSLEDRADALRQEADSLDDELERGRAALESLQGRKRQVEDATVGRSFEQALSQSQFAPGSDFGYGGGGGGIRVVDDPGSRREGFAAKRGRLGMPIAGTFEMNEATREGGVGLELVSSSGAAVHAVAEGRVAFADRYASYGRLIILDHGDGYYTVYGGLGHIAVQLDDYVGRGARLGEVGMHDGKTALFFEVRRGTRNVDARAWLGL